MVRVKICGITSLRDAQDAVEAGADALGFNFHPKSPRFVGLKKAAAIIPKLPPFVGTVGVFLDPELDLVRRVLGTCRIDWLQFHGHEAPGFLAQFPADKCVKALAVRDRSSLKALAAYRHSVSALLLDAWHPRLAGGTGRAFSWPWARQARRFGKPIILAGGLTPGNVAQAVREARPWAVDAASGVESAPGKKDPAKVRAFIRNAKAAA